MRNTVHLTLFDVPLLILDLGILIVTLLGSILLWGYLDPHVEYQDLALSHLRAGVLDGVLILILWPAIFYGRGLYHPRVGQWRWWQELLAVAIATGLGTLILFALLILRGIPGHALPLLSFAVTFTVADCCLRRARRALLHLTDLERLYQPHVIILGSGPAALSCAAQARILGYIVLGCVDVQPLTRDRALPYLGHFDDFPQLLRRHIVDKIIVAMPLASVSDKAYNIIQYAKEQGLHLVFPFAQLFGPIYRHIDIETGLYLEHCDRMGSTWSLALYSGQGAGGQVVAKRLMDIAGASLLLVLSAPIMGAAALGILLTMGRPVLFTQKRLGYHGRPFHIYKFRTMVKNADDLQDKLLAYNERKGPAFKMTHDPRVTPFGRILRKTSIDELPQLFNVIRGEMSLVGPRPLPLKDYERMGDEIFRKRLSVLPGITGPWQVSDRDRVSFDQWMAMEMDYVDHWSLALDLKILAKTVWVVLVGRGSK
ncbi:MAG: sugar transferase [Gammaproteobacteria bacterium]|nr:MAG: sugar transferase [Gammaproteobacteria bacterium]